MDKMVRGAYPTIVEGNLMMNTQQLIHDVEVLPPELQKQVVDFVSFLKKQQGLRIRKRTMGEYKGKIHISDDFDAPLGDDFWLGKS